MEIIGIELLLSFCCALKKQIFSLFKAEFL